MTPTLRLPVDGKVHAVEASVPGYWALRWVHPDGYTIECIVRPVPFGEYTVEKLKEKVE